MARAGRESGSRTVGRHVGREAEVPPRSSHHTRQGTRTPHHRKKEVPSYASGTRCLRLRTFTDESLRRNFRAGFPRPEKCSTMSQDKEHADAERDDRTLVPTVSPWATRTPLHGAQSSTREKRRYLACPSNRVAPSVSLTFGASKWPIYMTSRSKAPRALTRHVAMRLGGGLRLPSGSRRPTSGGRSAKRSFHTFQSGSLHHGASAGRTSRKSTARADDKVMSATMARCPGSARATGFAPRKASTE